jgi:TFIIF-interacting CTD phosphatase-like protein
MLISFYDTVFLSTLLQVSQWYELVVFTASMEIYGSAVADKLDNSRSILKRRYYRQVRSQSQVSEAEYQDGR